ncbi:unnamed protein product [Fraxinus pennsylvanica]|uniref:ApaG domain-containing protein n=1 Tax=Fraxinus pennsylvanica TaxID=56036 RepID=A0AAD1ZVA2_9LAMI|nr:unnamed protein product [Fraxinus pennsylvanica]
MGGVRFLSIEFKTFEFILEGGGVHSIRINELGRGFVHSVVMGRGCAIRVAGAIEDLISKPYIESFARTFRVGDAVIFLQRCSNRKGRFISIQEIHRGGRKGAIIIPEGRNGVGWRGFGVELRRHCVPEVKHGVLRTYPVPANQQKNEAGKVLYAEAASSTALPAGDAKGKQAVINLGDSTEIVQDFQPKMEKISLNMATCNSDSTGTETGRLQFCLNIQIVRGLDGAWGVKQANICGHKQGPEFPCGPNPRIDLKPNRSRPRMRFHKPKAKFVWRPKAVSKAKSIQNQFGPKPIAPFQSSLEGSVLNPLSSAPAKVSTPTNGPKPALTADMEATGLVPYPGECVTRAWGSSSDWVLELRDGRRLSIPFPLLHPGEDEFVYESCKPLPSSQGSIEGSFTFVPGRLADPKGGSFEVEVARFQLQLPDYIY